VGNGSPIRLFAGLQFWAKRTEVHGLVTRLSAAPHHSTLTHTATVQPMAAADFDFACGPLERAASAFVSGRYPSATLSVAQSRLASPLVSSRHTTTWHSRAKCNGEKFGLWLTPAGSAVPSSNLLSQRSTSSVPETFGDHGQHHAETHAKVSLCVILAFQEIRAAPTGTFACVPRSMFSEPPTFGRPTGERLTAGSNLLPQPPEQATPSAAEDQRKRTKI
jgi:hypothetical protein